MAGKPPVSGGACVWDGDHLAEHLYAPEAHTVYCGVGVLNFAELNYCASTYQSLSHWWFWAMGGWVTGSGCFWTPPPGNLSHAIFDRGVANNQLFKTEKEVVFY